MAFGVSKCICGGLEMSLNRDTDLRILREFGLKGRCLVPVECILHVRETLFIGSGELSLPSSDDVYAWKTRAAR